MLSDEADNFVREIKIDSEATFLDLHDIILRSVGYAKDQMSSFFTCDEDWGKETEITLVDMGGSSEEDSHIMEKTRLEELLGEEGQKLLYVFDYLTERAFFIELCEIIPGEKIAKPLCTRSEGTPPPQELNFEELEAKRSFNELMDEEFYGDSEYDIDELDSSGFGGLDNDSPFNEDRY
ncbi:MAG: hypothetical protein MdMp024_0319 [Bacteroidales bacterium]